MQRGLLKTSFKIIDLLDTALRELSDKQSPEVFGKVIQLITERRRENAIYILHDCHRYLSENVAGHDFLTALNIAVVKDAGTRLRRMNSGTQMCSSGLVYTANRLNLGLGISGPAITRQAGNIEISANPIKGTFEGVGKDRGEDLPGALYMSDDLVRLVDASAGMTLSNVSAVLRKAFKDPSPSAQDLLESIYQAKRSAIKRSPALELIENKGQTKISLGGMEEFSTWLCVAERFLKNPIKPSLLA